MNVLGRAMTCAVWRAITRFSSLGTIHAEAFDPSAEIRDRPAVFADSSSTTPSHAASRHTRSRIGALFSPMPPVKTTASSAGSQEAAAAIPAAARAANRSSASRAAASPRAAAASSSRTSPERPETPRSPASRSSAASTSSTGEPRRIIAVTIAGSSAPDRVPIMMPSFGVQPMDDHAERPPSTAVTDAPPPR